MNRKIKEAGYGQLQRKIFFQTILMGIAATLFICLLYVMVLSGRFANSTVWLIQHLLQVKWDKALDIYNIVFRRNMELIFIAAIILVFFVFLRFYLLWFSRYFDEINRGLDSLIGETGSDIALQPELLAIEKKINSIRHTLTKRKLDAQLSEQRKNDMIVYLAHDLKTPLTSVMGYLTLLNEEKEVSAKLREKYLSIALNKAERLEELINEFFEITRFNLSHMELSLQPVNLTRMLEQLAYEFRPVLAEKRLTYTIEAPPELTLLCDVDKLQRMFDNLLRNAVNYSFPDSDIRIVAVQLPQEVVVTVSNRGNTIPPEKLERIFERFYRLDTARATQTGGAGLGLAIAREIVELHGGRLAADSSDNTVTFTVRLPGDAGLLLKDASSFSS